ncbi:MAG: patatin-like phospholipase family protein, partial [Burkholderiales bacterium]|nr:patatin-like phospholipase family protein [Burkholderiales bacterium]
MNAVVYAYGKLRGNDGAREALHNFWKAVSDSGQQYSFKPNLWQKMWGMDFAFDMMSQMTKMMTSSYSPYQLNPFNYNPLRDILERQIDFEELERHSSTKLFLSATNVRTGKPKVFYTEQVNADIV